jgi:hypothetical protein
MRMHGDEAKHKDDGGRVEMDAFTLCCLRSDIDDRNSSPMQALARHSFIVNHRFHRFASFPGLESYSQILIAYRQTSQSQRS